MTKRKTAKQWGDWANKQLQERCPHGLTVKVLGDVVPTDKWDCAPCTATVVASVVRRVRREPSR